MADQKMLLLDVLQGRSYLVIQAALAHLQHRRLDLGPYTIEVVDEEAFPAVVFTNLDAPPGSPRRFGVRPDTGFDLNQREIIALTTGLDRKVQDTVRGASLPFIRAALAVFPRAAEVADYKLRVVSEGDSIVVIFADKDRPANVFGGGGHRPGYEVEMQAGNLQVRRANFVR